MIHGRDGLSVLKGIRAKGINTSVILVTARGELDDRLEGLNLGADDCLAKPFHIDELVARLRALYRRTSGAQLNVIRVDDLSINLSTREVIRGEEEIRVIEGHPHDCMKRMAAPPLPREGGPRRGPPDLRDPAPRDFIKFELTFLQDGGFNSEVQENES
jgi:response regulator RpfG family c-di-GMP phosphodiesterase